MAVDSNFSPLHESGSGIRIILPHGSLSSRRINKRQHCIDTDPFLGRKVIMSWSMNHLLESKQGKLKQGKELVLGGKCGCRSWAFPRIEAAWKPSPEGFVRSLQSLENGKLWDPSDTHGFWCARLGWATSMW